ncbi:MAG: histone H1 [Pseudomonadaceae bacterium]|nr:histone H1 [Pseudomonadaceae bacterium]|tara:strand:+ start:137 stop:403 length:267 start_codon:yes stop_codon:yes gene_type:complete
MSGLEIFQNGTSLHPDTMGEPIYQIGTKNADGGYDAVVFDAMTKKEAQARLADMQPKAPKAKPVAKKKPAVKKVAKKAKAKKKPTRKR